MIFHKLQNEIFHPLENSSDFAKTSATSSSLNSVFIIIHLATSHQIDAIHARVISFIERINSSVGERMSQNNTHYTIFYTLPQSHAELHGNQIKVLFIYKTFYRTYVKICFFSHFIFYY